MIKAISSIFHNHAEDSSDAQSEVKEYLDKIDTLAYRLNTRERMDRMLYFSSKLRLMEVLRKSFVELQAHQDPPIVLFWSTVTCLVQDATPPSVEILDRLADKWILANERDLLLMLHDSLMAYPELGAWTPLTAKTTHFLRSQFKVPPASIQLANHLGINLPPGDRRWQLEWSLVDHPKARALLPETPYTLLSLTVNYPPEQVEAHSWTVSIRKTGEQPHVYFRENSAEKLLVKGDQFFKAEFPGSILRFPEFIDRVESFYNVRFRIDPLFSFSKHGLNQRDLEKRIVGWLTKSSAK